MKIDRVDDICFLSQVCLCLSQVQPIKEFLWIVNRKVFKNK